MDGVNVSDPEGGSAWVFLDHNIIEEAKVMGLGLPAEYGNFTGVIFNLVTKSGGNEFSGHFELDFQGKPGDFPNDFWQTDNNHDYVDDWPDVTSPINKLFDVNVHVGGPIRQDKLWFYVGLQYYRTWFFPTGIPGSRNYYQPRSFWKLSSQLSPSTPMLSLEVDTYNGVNRAPSASHAEIGRNPRSPEIARARRQSQPDTYSQPQDFLRYQGRLLLGLLLPRPEKGRDVNAHFDINVNMLRATLHIIISPTVPASRPTPVLTHYAEDFIKGDHDFKFGVEIERSCARSRYGLHRREPHVLRRLPGILLCRTPGAIPGLSVRRATTSTASTSGSRASPRTPGRSRSA